MSAPEGPAPAGGAGEEPPPVPSPAETSAPAPRPSFAPLVTVVGFHHARGPEVETWFGAEDGQDPAVDYDWSLLPFMALSDGAHATNEDFSYFTLLRPAIGDQPATSLFGISCTRQMDANLLINRPADVTRSTVQKAVVVIADNPQYFGVLRQRLGVVTQAWFMQRDFTDVEILRGFQESLADEKAKGLLGDGADQGQPLGMNLRELVREFKWQTLVLLKCALLQPKMLFFGSRCERLCMVQFSLISLIPSLIQHLQDCADPELHSYEKTMVKPTRLQSASKVSLLAYMGLPLQIFGKGSLFGPYTPLQQLDILADFGTKSYIVGSTNSLLLQQRDRYSDILINLDEVTINVTSPSLRAALALSVADRRMIDFVVQEVNNTWDERDPSRPKTLGYVGSEEFIRMQFADYIQSLLSCVKYRNFRIEHPHDFKIRVPDAESDPILEFNVDWVEAWMKTDNYRIWNANTDADLFDVVDPKHPFTGALTMDDVQRRLAAQVQEMRLDEKLAEGREVLNRGLAAGKEKASAWINRVYSDVEQFRETQKRRTEEARAAMGPSAPEGGRNGAGPSAAAFPAVDLSRAQQTMQSVGVKAGAYMSSWASWAGEKRKAAGWGLARGGRGAAGGALARAKPEDKNGGPALPEKDKEYQMVTRSNTGLSTKLVATDDGAEKQAWKQAETPSEPPVARPASPLAAKPSPPPPKQEYTLPAVQEPPVVEEKLVRKSFLAFYRDEPKAENGEDGPLAEQS